MTMSTDQRLALAAAMRRSAEARRCERCGRRAAMVDRFDGGYRTYICYWAELGKCDDPGATGRWRP